MYVNCLLLTCSAYIFRSSLLYYCIIMKSKKLYTKLLLAGSLMLLSGSLTSCDDFLTLLPTDQLPEENFWQDKSDVDGVRAGAYDQLAASGQTERILQWGELRADNLSLNNVSNTAIDNLQNAVLQPNEGMFDWSGFYTGINLCNLVIEKGAEMTVPGKEVDPSFTLSEYRAYCAEMTALRSLYYFYLVRAYRDVPYITKSIRTDAEARASHPAAVSGVAIIGECIKQVEENLKYAADNYGSDSDNRGRFTKKGLKALLADMYLWRGCMLKDYMKKENASNQVNLSDVLNADGTYTTGDTTIVDNAYCNAEALECFKKAKSYAASVITDLKTKYDEEVAKNPNAYTAEERTQSFPLYLNDRRSTTITDVPYSNNFGAQNSLEGIFELQYDGTTVTNSTVNGYLSTYSNNSFTPAAMALSNTLIASAQSVDPSTGFGKTDLRLLETCYYQASTTSKPVCKFVLRNFGVKNTLDLTETDAYNGISGRTSSSNDAHWPVYRLSDMMLIEAEAIARIGMLTDKFTLEEAREGYKLVAELFKRNNPALVATTAEANAQNKEATYVCQRIDSEAYVTADNKGKVNRTASDLLQTVYKERQREFIAEGKRWFDLVRQAEYSYVDSKKSTGPALGFGSFKSQVTGRLTKLYSLYNPIYSEEMKVNGKGQADGGQLVQNPIWDRYTKK